jgi:hypothetical protein
MKLQQPMTLQEFKSSLSHNEPPAGSSQLLVALWHDGKGNWDASHDIAQDIHSNDGSWIHAYLHRKEGDTGNAAYWYRKAGKPYPTVSPEMEWNTLVNDFLAR